ncbi:hypothetical protein [Spirillospora sp. CA-128828]|uniref:hypothetical protein n=1 Tax=Spirillospora sp. CA-128828 TaxID=3240033 RepID=UPI003D94C245
MSVLAATDFLGTPEVISASDAQATSSGERVNACFAVVSQGSEAISLPFVARDELIGMAKTTVHKPMSP